MLIIIFHMDEVLESVALIVFMIKENILKDIRKISCECLLISPLVNVILATAK